MIVKSVSLMQMRNYEKLSLELGNGINILFGENAQGKTNFLESIYFCATGRSPRTHSDRELIQFGKPDAHMQVFVEKDYGTDRIDAQIRKDIIKGVAAKGIAVNGIPVKKLSELFGVLLTVIFSPEDLMIVKAGPAERRRFIDMELCQLSAVYYYELQQYHQSLKQRNALLKKIQKDKNLKETIFVWNEQLFEHGKRIINYRTEFIERLSRISAQIHASMTGARESLQIQYKPNVPAEHFIERLNKALERDILNGTTSVGIHKDEICFLINGNDARIYGSQGQQRTASIAAKMAEITLIKEEKGETPVLLLDDVFSELDANRRKQLVGHLDGVQTLITCAGEDDAVRFFQKTGFLNISCYEVISGNIFFTKP